MPPAACTLHTYRASNELLLAVGARQEICGGIRYVLVPRQAYTALCCSLLFIETKIVSLSTHHSNASVLCWKNVSQYSLERNSSWCRGSSAAALILSAVVDVWCRPCKKCVNVVRRKLGGVVEVGDALTLNLNSHRLKRPAP